MKTANMRSTSSVLAAGLLSVSLLTPVLARAETVPAKETAVAQPAAESSWIDPRLLGTGAGAVVGIVAFNVLTGPFGTVPFAGGALQAVPYSIALGSRVLAAASAGVGALAGAWAYDVWNGTKSNYTYLVSLGAGAFAGVVAGNYLALGTLGVPPYYLGAAAAEAGGAMASTAAQAASRVYVIGSGVLGAWVADLLYGHNK